MKHNYSNYILIFCNIFFLLQCSCIPIGFKEIFVSHVIVVSKKRQLKLASQIIVSVVRWRGGKVHGKGSAPDAHKSSDAVHMHR